MFKVYDRIKIREENGDIEAQFDGAYFKATNNRLLVIKKISQSRDYPFICKISKNIDTCLNAITFCFVSEEICSINLREV
jgi:hypothetical protein